MKIIKKGKVEKSTHIYRGVCEECGAEIECDDYDRWGDLALSYFHVKCPTKHCDSYTKVKQIKK